MDAAPKETLHWTSKYKGMRTSEYDGRRQMAYLLKKVKRLEPISRPVANVVKEAKRDSIE